MSKDCKELYESLILTCFVNENNCDKRQFYNDMLSNNNCIDKNIYNKTKSKLEELTYLNLDEHNSYIYKHVLYYHHKYEYKREVYTKYVYLNYLNIFKLMYFKLLSK